MDSSLIPSLIERWEDVQETIELDTLNDTDFALRADKIMVFFDQYGYFTVKDAGPGWLGKPQTSEFAQHKLVFCDQQGQHMNFYCEPTWIASFYNHFKEMG